MIFAHYIGNTGKARILEAKTHEEVFKMFEDWGFTNKWMVTTDTTSFSMSDEKGGWLTISNVWFPYDEPVGMIHYEDPVSWFIDVIDDWENPKESPKICAPNYESDFDWDASSIDIHGGIFFGF